ncbi:PREDICTED: uncharacterized protein LOC104808864 [Tarenaya hassleriana]|uniref:uncharacterized protein LOC104808864 n=1 Tax=Tarenaya hassleriana TaxID=28532 RepID=UPI00053C6A1F|nr:PREDICTED: uncharacterized protein LOC104808864 [Tarenaya hassleriana]
MAVEDCSLDFSHHMEDFGRIVNVSVVWRGNRYVVEIDSGACLKDLGDELRKLSGVKSETLRLIVPCLNEKGSKLLFPFSNEHSRLSLQEASILEGKPIRMMGVSEDEVDSILKDAKTDLRILGFEEEERRLRQKVLYVPGASLKLPQGPYIFCDFRTLELPGIELNPPPSEALKRMHRLAADPGIVAIMNKHRWRVGIMTELAPVGYVGVTPECVLGFNKNHGEEISLRLRTDDLKGFRKYESIKKTLLHELAHMVYSEHDEHFYALDKQLNQEANSLDWTKSRGHTLSGAKNTDDFEEEDYYFSETKSFSQRLGGSQSDHLADARASSVSAAYRRLTTTTADDDVILPEVREEPDSDELVDLHDETGPPNYAKSRGTGMDSDDQPDTWDKLEPDPDDTTEVCKSIPYPNLSVVSSMSRVSSEAEYQTEIIKVSDNQRDDGHNPDDNLEKEANDQRDENRRSSNGIVISDGAPRGSRGITEREISEVLIRKDVYGNSNPQDYENQTIPAKSEPENAEPDPDDDNQVLSDRKTIIKADEPDLDDEEIHRIQDSVTIITSRLQKAVDKLQAEVNPTESMKVLQTLLKVVRNAIEHPGEMKFKRLRKGNSAIQRNILNYAAAVEILFLVGFVEDIVSEGTGQLEAYLVLKRNDPGLLWLAKSFLEASISA